LDIAKKVKIDKRKIKGRWKVDETKISDCKHHSAVQFKEMKVWSVEKN
jgi:hypothetical protein